MPDPDTISILLSRALFPLIAAGVLLVFWRVGWLSPRFLRAGPHRRLRLPRPLWWGALGIALLHPVLSLLSLAVGAGGQAADPETATPPTTLQLLRESSQLIAPALFVALAFALPDGARRLGLARPGVGRNLLWGALLALPATALAFGFNALAGLVGVLLGDPPPELGHRVLIELLDDLTLENLLTVCFAAVVYAPLAEELAYRGFAQTVLGDRLGRHRRGLTIGLVALLFAAMHLPAVTWHALPGLFVLGVVWGAMYERTGSIWGPIAAHAVFNALNLAIVLALTATGAAVAP
jgi:membrane protease YdiL (CAAX protease family)